MPEPYPVQGAGLGLRRDFLRALAGPAPLPAAIDFLEAAPENWIDVGGRLGRRFREVAEKAPLVCHGLSLNLGGAAPLDEAFLRQVRRFLDRFEVRCYSEHLSYCADDGHLYDLMPIPFTRAAVRHAADRIQCAQDLLGRRLAIENVSYYAAPGQEMTELEFITEVLEASDCDLLLDVNNVYVNSVNHCYDAADWLKSLPRERLAYAHVAGHYTEAKDLLVDTHGAAISDPVWDLLDLAYQHFGVFPTLLERDFNIPPLPALLQEVDRIRQAQSRRRDQGETARAAQG